MALWGTDETQDESKPTWQKDRDPTGSKGRPAINEERNTLPQQRVGCAELLRVTEQSKRF